MSEFSGNDLYQIKVSLIGPKPPIWRRLVVPKTISLDELHSVIQSAFGWQNMHLYRFEKGDLQYQKMEDYGSDLGFLDMKEIAGVQLKTLLRNTGNEIKYVYDFGADWEHNISLEKSSLPEQALPQIPICTDGKGRCPCEDGRASSDEEFGESEDEEEGHDRVACKKEREYDRTIINQRLANISPEH